MTIRELIIGMPKPAMIAASALFGLIFGSFANVLVYRVPRKQSIAWPNSFCPSCSKSIAWFDNIPLLSFFALRGQCRHCKARISIRYPIIEAITASLFVACFLRFGLQPLLFLRDWPLMVILVAITFIDLEFRIIPDRLNLVGLLIGLATSWATPEMGWKASIAGVAIGFLIFFLLGVVYERLTGRAGLGGGDVKYLAMIGAWIGPVGVFQTVFLSSILGSVIGIGWALATKQKKALGASIPYGPFLVIATLWYYLCGEGTWLPFMNPM